MIDVWIPSDCFRSLLLLQFLFDSRQTWHAWSMYQYAKAVEQIISKFWF